MIMAAASAVSAFADTKSDALLGGLAKKVASWGNYRVDFSVTIDGQAVAGSYVVSGGKYRVTTPDIVLFCDGKTKYEVNLSYKEIVVDDVDPLDRTVLGNPTRLFDFLDGSYTHRYVGPAVIGGVNCERMELTENGVKDGQKSDVYLSAATGLPVRLSYRMGMMNTDATIDVVKITPDVTVANTDFTYDPKQWAGYEMIDFR